MKRGLAASRPSAWPIAVAVVVVSLLALAGGAGVWRVLDALVVDRTVSRFDTLKMTLAIVAGFGGLVALTVAYRKQRDGEAGRFGSDFAAAGAQLGGSSAAVRIAGVYAMAALADAARHHEGRQQQCIDALCAYLRLPYHPAEDAALMSNATTRTSVTDGSGYTREDVRTYTLQPQEREVRLTIITVIRDHLQSDAKAGWNGRYFNFTGAVFDGGDFAGARFTGGVVSFAGARFVGGRVSFDGADFAGARVSFTGARFTGGEVSFAGARFVGGRVFFEWARFTGGEVSFTWAQFSGGEISFKWAEFTGGAVSFEWARFAGARVPFTWAQFTGGEISFDEARFTGGVVSFEWGQFAGGRVDLRLVSSWVAAPELPVPLPRRGLWLPMVWTGQFDYRPPTADWDQ